MLLLRKLGIRINKKGRKESWAIFKCPKCLQEVERQLSNGKIAKTCGKHRGKENNNNYGHGESGTKLYDVWSAIKQRCLNKKSKDYKNYGGRGITICPEWLDFIPFRDWALSNGYSEGLQIDRINNNEGYNPENCHFVTSAKNCQNRKTTILTINIVNEIRDLYKTRDYTQ